VDLASTRIGDADLERLARDPMFTRVTTLVLAGTQITDRGVAVLSARPFFVCLDLSRTSVTDQGLASISNCCSSTLNLSGTRVTDATFGVLEQQAERFPNRSIDLTDTQVTEARVKDFVSSHRMTVVRYGSSASPKSTN
jgi:Leucine Rich repeat